MTLPWGEQAGHTVEVPRSLFPRARWCGKATQVTEGAGETLTLPLCSTPPSVCKSSECSPFLKRHFLASLAARVACVTQFWLMRCR